MMTNFKYFDLDLSKVSGDTNNSNLASALTYSNCTCGPVCEQTIKVCTTIAYPCKTIATCEGVTCNTGASCGCSMNCSPTDMGMCDRKKDVKNGIENLRRC